MAQADGLAARTAALVGVGEDDALGVQFVHDPERGQALVVFEILIGHLHLPSDSKMA